MNYKECAEFCISNIFLFDNEMYNIGLNSFQRKRKWEFMDYVIYILCDCGKTTTLQIEDFVEDYFNNNEEKLITKQAFSKQRQNINPMIYKDMNYAFVEMACKSSEYTSYFKGRRVILVDGSKSELPNVKQTREEFEVPKNTRKYRQPARTMFSTCVDLETHFVLDSILAKAGSSERDLLKQHIESLEKYIDLSNTILIIDRGYFSLDMLLYLENKGIDYIFRLKSNTYIDERYHMDSDDEYLDIKLNSNRIQNIKDKKIKKQAKEMKILHRRFVNHKLRTSKKKITDETLLTNLPSDVASYDDLKYLYNDRWEIELNYEKIKNKLHIENYSGRTELTICQDFYSQMYVFNIFLALKNEIEEQLEEENKKLRKEKNKEKRANSNILMGRLKKRIIELILASKKQREIILDKMISRSKKNTIDHKFDRESTNRNKTRFTGKNRSNIRPNGT